ncbi:MAG: lipocalin-like domain-containing protein [Chloroflexi bacterium]|nr:lipocalin-like domain-containing protein [Chloroflexota bacterium]
MAQDEPLVGTWKLISFERSVDGKVSYPMGKEARGSIAYDALGRMSVQIMRPDRPALTGATAPEGTLDELRAIIAGYLAYAGTYDVDRATKTVTHHIDLHLLPSGVGTQLRRQFEIAGNRLTLKTPPVTVGGRQQSGRLVWERVE